MLSIIDEYPDFLPKKFATQQKFKKMMLDLTKKSIKIDNNKVKLFLFMHIY